MKRWFPLAYALTFVGLAGATLVGACGTDLPPSQTVTDDLTAGAVSATLSFQSDWGNGYCANVVISNGGTTAITGWQVVINLNQSAESQLWNAAPAIAGTQLTVGPVSWNASVAPGSTASFGFCGNATGGSYHPTLVSVSSTGGSSSGTGGSTGAGGAIVGVGGHTGAAGATGTGGGSPGVGGHVGAGGSIAGTGGAVAGTGGAMVGTGGHLTGTGGAMAGTGGATSTGACTPGTAGAGTVSVNTCTVKQPIDGFGAADVWAGAMPAAQITLFFDPTNGIGLSLLRIGIDVNGTPLGSGAYADAMAANKFGVKVWGAPWSPPAGDKSNGSIDNGGTLNTGSYSSWASILAGFATTFKSKTGFALYGISAQNEPDFSASYASCIYNSSQMVAFVKVLGPMLAALNPPVNLLAAEPDSWSNLWGGDNYGNAILADSAASAAVNIIATHDYGHKSDSVTTRPSPPVGTKQHIWETEMSDETAPDVDISHGIQVATWIYAGLTTGGASAWHYWWLNNSNSDGEGLLQKAGTTGDINSPPKRLYTMGNFSKFIRPGYVRVDVTGTVPSGVLLSAFKSTSDGTVVVVAINPGTGSVSLPIFLSGSGATTITPWVTSASLNLASQTAITVSGSSFSATLAGQSVTTFVGK